MIFKRRVELFFIVQRPKLRPYSQDLNSNSPYCLPYKSYNVSLENLVLDQLMIPWLIFVFILITCLDGIALIL